MRLFELALLFYQNRRGRARFAVFKCLRTYCRTTFTTIEGSANQLDQTLVIDISCRGDDQVIVIKLARVITDSRFVIESRYGFPRAFDRAAERLIGEVSRVKKLSEQLVRRVLDHFHLFEDDFLLAFEVFLFKTGVRNEVGE